MKYLLLLLVAGSVQAENLPIVRGGTVEDGGNSVFCRHEDMVGGDGPAIPPQKPGLGSYYALDYARAIVNGRKPEDFAMERDWTSHSQRIERILRDVSPSLQATFRAFVESTEQIGISGNPRKLKRVWVKARQFQIVENNVGYAPRSCMAVLQDSEDLHLGGAIVSFRGYMRTVTRRKTGDYVEYRYMPNELKLLTENSPLQYSMLLVHEWLWDHTRKLDVNQRVNEFLHTKAVDSMSNAEVRRELRRLGLRL